MAILSTITLDSLPAGERGVVMAVDWGAMDAIDARRLVEFGIFEGAEIELLHRGTAVARDPLAVAVGRTTVMLRGAQAAAIMVTPLLSSARLPLGAAQP